MAKYDLDLRMGIDEKLQTADIDIGALSYSVDKNNFYIDALKEDKVKSERQQIDANKSYNLKNNKEHIIATYSKYGDYALNLGKHDDIHQISNLSGNQGGTILTGKISILENDLIHLNNSIIQIEDKYFQIQKYQILSTLDIDVYEIKFEIDSYLDVELNSDNIYNLYLYGSTHDYAIAEGFSTKANGFASHSEGQYTQAIGESSHAEGINTVASGNYSHAEGGFMSHAEGESSHAEGKLTHAKGTASHAEGSETEAIGINSHAEGSYTKASGSNAHAQGNNTIAKGEQSFATGLETEANGENSVATGNNTIVDGNNSLSLGFSNIIKGNNSLVGGYNNISLGNNILGFGKENKINGYNSFVHGNNSISYASNNILIGDGLISHSINALILGTYNKEENPLSATKREYKFDENGNIISISGSSGYNHMSETMGLVSKDVEVYTDYYIDENNKIQLIEDSKKIITLTNSNNTSEEIAGFYKSSFDNGLIVYGNTTLSQDNWSQEFFDPFKFNNLFIIGNGTGEDNRSNAFTVNTKGDTFMAGNLTATNGYFSDKLNVKNNITINDVNVITQTQLDTTVTNLNTKIEEKQNLLNLQIGTTKEEILAEVDQKISALQTDIWAKGETPPENTKLLWIRTGTDYANGILYYYTGDTTNEANYDGWIPMSAAYS